MITAAMATMATVDTRPCYPCGLFVKTYAASETARALASATLRRDEHGEVGVKRDPLDATNAKGLQSVAASCPPEGVSMDTGDVDRPFKDVTNDERARLRARLISEVAGREAAEARESALLKRRHDPDGHTLATGRASRLRRWLIYPGRDRRRCRRR
jgi:hypothetical protein